MTKSPFGFEQVYLSRRNLLTLLSKLDRRLAGDDTHATIIKRDVKHPRYPASVVFAVTAVEDHDYYTDREAGPIDKADEPNRGENRD